MIKSPPHIDFIIGEDKPLSLILSRPEVEQLLEGAVACGISRAVLSDECGSTFASAVSAALPEDYIAESLLLQINVEGEPQGGLIFESAHFTPAHRQVARLVQLAIQLMVNNNLKRVLTTELHTSVVQESYDQLVETNRHLQQSEARYRLLAEELEVKVEERSIQLRSVYEKLLQQEKLAAVGRLAAGMAHEINNPIGFIRSNLASLSHYSERFIGMLRSYRDLLKGPEESVAIRRKSEQRWNELKLDFLMEDTPLLIAQSLDGVDRVAKIVAELKVFGSVDDMIPVGTDINAVIEELLATLAPSFPPDTRLVTDLKPLKQIQCRRPLILMALANILDNAVKSGTGSLEISASTRQTEESIVITISDNGSGISAEDLPRIFDPFFTTRPVGSGTGMGLAVARDAITGHGGDLQASSTPDLGTTITIRLPLDN